MKDQSNPTNEFTGELRKMSSKEMFRYLKKVCEAISVIEREEARESGAKWAANSAHPPELQRLEEMVDIEDFSQYDHHELAQLVVDYLFDTIDGSADGFWIEVLDDPQPEAKQIAAFVDGAMEASGRMKAGPQIIEFPMEEVGSE